jgi:hypothetical protein
MRWTLQSSGYWTRKRACAKGPGIGVKKLDTFETPAYSTRIAKADRVRAVAGIDAGQCSHQREGDETAMHDMVFGGVVPESVSPAEHFAHPQ